MHKRITNADERHPHTKVPDGFHGFPFGVCPWCSGPPDDFGNKRGEEGCNPIHHVRHGGPCPRVKVLEFNEYGGIAKLKLGPPYKDMKDL